MIPSASGSEGRLVSGVPYVVIWAVLLLLTAASFGVDLLRIAGFTLPATLVIAALKAALVGWFFMHLRHAPFGIRLIALLTAAWVLMICVGIAADVAAR
jgi:cytochrome c oxidase subunit IV